MIEVTASKSFKKKYKKRIISTKLRNRFQQRLDLFKKNPSNKVLKDHSLKGSLVGYRAFSITGDVRVVYKSIGKNRVRFIDVGTHNQVYK